MANYIVGITGASGSIYGVRLVDILIEKGHFVYLVISDAGRLIMEEEIYGARLQSSGVIEFGEFKELNLSNSSTPKLSNSKTLKPCTFHLEQIEFVDCHNISHPIASGSTQIDAMIVAPCSMNTLAHIACGASTNLIHRAADVTIKEKRPLIIVPRETPLSPIHLKNMLRLSRIGVHILPAMPALYIHPETINEMVDFIVGKILDLLKMEHNLYKRWQPQIRI